MIARHLRDIGLRTVPDLIWSHKDYPSGYNEHLPILVFEKACERLHGSRARPTDQELLREEYLEVPGMRAFFEASYAPLRDSSIDFIKSPDTALYLRFLSARHSDIHYLAIWRNPEDAISSYFRREFGRYPGWREYYRSIVSWNLYAKRILDFKKEFPSKMTVWSIDRLIASDYSLAGSMRKLGYKDIREINLQNALGKPWRRSRGIARLTIDVMERSFRMFCPPSHKPYFSTYLNVRALRGVSEAVANEQS